MQKKEEEAKKEGKEPEETTIEREFEIGFTQSDYKRILALKSKQNLKEKKRGAKYKIIVEEG